MNTAKQVKDLIRNLSRKIGVDPQILLRQYMIEHLLERISLSRYNECFILKGGMLISALVGIALRSTLDMDATIKGFSLEQNTLMEIANEIIGIKMDDGIRYEINSIDNIHQDSEYNGYRLSLTAFLDESRIPLKMDITTEIELPPKKSIFHTRCYLKSDRSEYSVIIRKPYWPRNWRRFLAAVSQIRV